MEKTKVICPQCGCEIAIAEHEHFAAGMAIGKDSGLGTVVLPKAGSGRGRQDDLHRYSFTYYWSADEDVQHEWVEAKDVWEAIDEFFHGHWGVTEVVSVCLSGKDILNDRSRKVIADHMAMSRGKGNGAAGCSDNNNINNGNKMANINSNSGSETMANINSNSNGGAAVNGSMMELLMKTLVKELSENKEQQRAFFGSLAQACGLDVRELAGGQQGDMRKTEPAKVQKSVNDMVRQHIKDAGWVHNVKLYHNHAERQMYEMLGSVRDVMDDNDKYTEHLKQKEYDYQFGQIIKQLGNIVYLEEIKRDFRGAREISRWYSMARVVEMLREDLRNTREFCDSRPRKVCTRNDAYTPVEIRDRRGELVRRSYDYIEVPGIGERNAAGQHASELGKGCVFVSELDVCLYSRLQALIDRAAEEKTARGLLRIVRKYNSLRIRLPWDWKKCSSWVNAYKGLGSYRTLVNLVRFDGLLLRRCDADDQYCYYDSRRNDVTLLSQAETMKVIEERADKFGDAEKYTDGYAMLGLLRAALKASGVESWPSKK